LNKFLEIKNCQNTIDNTKEWWEVENARRDKLPRFMVRIHYPDSKYNTGDVVNSFGADFIFDKKLYDFFKSYPDVFEEIDISLAHALNKTGMFDN